MGEFHGERGRAEVAAAMAGDAVRPRLDDPRLRAGAGRAQLHAGADADLPGDDGGPPDPALGPLPRLRDRRAEPVGVRQRRPTPTRPGRDTRRHDLVHRHERAERRLGPRRAADPSRGVRRPLRRERPEGVDVVRRDRAEVLLLRAHRSERGQAPRHLAAHGRHGHAGYRGASALAHLAARRTSPRCSSPMSRCRARTSWARSTAVGRSPRVRSRTNGPASGSKGCRASNRRCRRWSTSLAAPAAPTTRSCAARSPRPTSWRRACARSATRDSRRSPRVRRRPSTRT